MRKLSRSYEENVLQLDTLLACSDNFDIIKKKLKVGSDELTLYYIDGFVKDGVMQKLMLHFVSLSSLSEKGDGSALSFMEHCVPYVETEVLCDLDKMLSFVLSGATLMLGSTFKDEAILIDSRTYPARETGEPESDKVVRGAKDGFVETLIFNTALIRRRIRDTSLRMHYMSVGSTSKTDIVVCYMKSKADPSTVSAIKKKLSELDTGALSMGHQSLAESLVGKRWYNPFPKFRSTERPDAACAQLLEGSVLIITDNTPEVIVLPTTIFDFMQETNDFYFPPLTGTYIRLLRHFVFWMTLFTVPLWLLLVKMPSVLPPELHFMIPESYGKLPLIIQIFLVEFVIDVLRLASMNTPNMLTNSLSVVGGLILGDFAVSAGWLIPEVILLMAFVAIANFTQRSLELGYAFKFLRMMLLLLVQLFGLWGLLAGTVLIAVFLLTNRSVLPDRSYLYPLIPFDGKALLSLFIRLPKSKKRDS